MNIIKKNRKLFAVLILFLSNILVFSETKTSIKWKLSLVIEDATEVKTDELSHIINLPSGTEYSLLIESESSSECYVILEKTDKTSIILFDGHLEAGNQMYLPDENFGDDVFTVDSSTGIEKIYVIVSKFQQTDLEKLLNKKSSKTIDKNLSDKILDEISFLKQNVSSYTEQPVKPAVTGGTTRSLQIKRIVPYTEFDGADVYVKTIRISH